MGEDETWMDGDKPVRTMDINCRRCGRVTKHAVEPIADGKSSATCLRCMELDAEAVELAAAKRRQAEVEARASEMLQMDAAARERDRQRDIKATIAEGKKRNRKRDLIIVGALAAAGVGWLVYDSMQPKPPEVDLEGFKRREAETFLRDFDVFRVEACRCKTVACWDDVRQRADKFFRSSADSGVHLDSNQAAEKTAIILSIAVCKEGLR